jgi:hypothetical protein
MRMRMLPQNLQNRLARAGDFARLPAQTAGQCGHFLPPHSMGMRFHVVNEPFWDMQCQLMN